MGPDLYKELGIPRDADEATIRRAYRARAKDTHPNAGGDLDEWARTSTALSVLIDPARRKTYDDTGRIEEDKPDIDGAAAIGILQGHVSAIVNDYISSGFAPAKDPRRLDVAALLVDRIEAEVHAGAEAVLVGEKVVAYLRDMMARFTQKSGEPAAGDPVARGFKDQIGQNEERIAEVRTSIRYHKTALELAKGYSFRFDAPADGYFSSAYAAGARFR